MELRRSSERKVPLGKGCDMARGTTQSWSEEKSVQRGMVTEQSQRL